MENWFFDHVYQSDKGGKVRICFKLPIPVNALKKIGKDNCFFLKEQICRKCRLYNHCPATFAKLRQI